MICNRQVRPAVAKKVRLWTEHDSARIGVVLISPPDSIRIPDTLGVHTFAYAAIGSGYVGRHPRSSGVIDCESPIRKLSIVRRFAHISRFFPRTHIF